MKKIFLSLLRLLVISPCQATGINVKRKTTTPKGGMLMPTIMRACVDYENGNITEDMRGYTDRVQGAFVMPKVMSYGIQYHQLLTVVL